jgi:hypothetical protein
VVGPVLDNILALHNTYVEFDVIETPIAAYGLPRENRKGREPLVVGERAGLNVQPLAGTPTKGVIEPSGPETKPWTKPTSGTSIPPGIGDGTGRGERVSLADCRAVSDAACTRLTAPTMLTMAALAAPASRCRRLNRSDLPYGHCFFMFLRMVPSSCLATLSAVTFRLASAQLLLADLTAILQRSPANRCSSICSLVVIRIWGLARGFTPRSHWGVMHQLTLQ